MQHTPIARRTARHPDVRDIRDLLTFRLAAISTACDRLGQRWLSEDYDLRITEWRVLGVAAALAPVRFQAIARALLMDKGRLSRIVAVLSARGLVETAPDDEDQRIVLIELTEKGRSLHDRILARALARNEAVAAALSPDEFEQLMRLMDKLEPFMFARAEPSL